MRDGYAAGIDRGRIAATAASCSVALLRRDDMEAARAAWQEDLAKDRRPGRGGSRRRSNPHGGPRVAARLGLALRFDAFGPGPASAQRCDRRATRQRGRPTRSVPGATLESNRARYDRPRRRGGTLRIRESVPARRDQPAAFAMRTVFWDGASRRICPGCSLGERSRRARHAEPFTRGRGNATPHFLTAAPESDLRGRCVSPPRFRDLRCSSSPPRAWTAFAQRAPRA